MKQGARAALSEGRHIYLDRRRQSRHADLGNDDDFGQRLDSGFSFMETGSLEPEQQEQFDHHCPPVLIRSSPLNWLHRIHDWTPGKRVRYMPRLRFLTHLA